MRKLVNPDLVSKFVKLTIVLGLICQIYSARYPFCVLLFLNHFLLNLWTLVPLRILLVKKLVNDYLFNVVFDVPVPLDYLLVQHELSIALLPFLVDGTLELAVPLVHQLE